MGASSDSPVANSPKPDQHEAAPEVDLAQQSRERKDRPDGKISEHDVSFFEQPETRELTKMFQALRELSKGEQTATAMEANLSNLESKLDALLAAFEHLEEEKGGNSTGKEGGAPEQKSKPEEK